MIFILKIRAFVNGEFKIVHTELPEMIAQYSSFLIELLVPQNSYLQTDAFTMTFVRPDGYKTTELSGTFNGTESINGIEYLNFKFKMTPFHTNILPGTHPTGTAHFSFRWTRVDGVVITHTFSTGIVKIAIHRSVEPELEVFGDGELSSIQSRLQAIEARLDELEK